MRIERCFDPRNTSFFFNYLRTLLKNLLIDHWFLCKTFLVDSVTNIDRHLQNLLTATEFFMSATAEVNSGKWNSGQYTRGKLRSPDLRPATAAFLSHSYLMKNYWFLFYRWSWCILSGTYLIHNSALFIYSIPYLRVR